MKVTFVDVDRDTLFLLPPSIQEWLPEKHLARFVVEIVEQIDLQPLKSSYCGRGFQPYSPEMNGSHSFLRIRHRRFFKS